MAQITQRPAKNTNSSGAEMARSHDFPVLFTIDGSNRHEGMFEKASAKPKALLTGAVVLVNPGLDLEQLKQSAEALLESPNCAEVLSKYRNKEKTDSVAEIRVKWSSEGRDKLFPQQTLLTEHNVEPVLRLMAVNVGKDVFDVKLAQKNTGEGSAKPGSEPSKK